jgi:hypothetical protein
MKKALFVGRALSLAVVLAAIVSNIARAAPLPPSVDTSWCTDPLLSQPFLGHGDRHQYMLLPGESPGNFDGTGWTLSGGASIVTTTLDNGDTGSVLDLPSGAMAVSPTVCVTSEYPKARSMVRDIVGSDGVAFAVSYEGKPSWDAPKGGGKMHGKNSGWSLSGGLDVHPGGDPGWQPVRFVLTGGGKASDYQVYNFYVDPRMKN